jgi:hypothetical protein
VKSDVERGPFGAWAFRARDQLDLAVEAVAEMLGYHPASLRKLESGSAPASRRMRRELPDLYRRLAAERGVVLDAAPAEDALSEPDLVSVVRELVEEVRLSRLSQERSTGVLADLLGYVMAGRLPQSETEDAAGAPVHRDTE